MIKFLYKKYWAIGFQSRLYDLLAPQAYLDSIARLVASAGEGDVWLDAGCGSGLSLPFFKKRLRDARYLGTDLTAVGLARTLEKIRALDVKGHCFLADFTKELPLRENSVDIVCAHFSTYTISGNLGRIQALKNFYKVLKPEGTLALANPSQDYNAKRIIRESLDRVGKEDGAFAFLAKKLILYPSAFWFGLRFIERQLKTGTWKSYTLEELSDEVRLAGFKIKFTAKVYAGSGYLVVAKKPT